MKHYKQMSLFEEEEEIPKVNELLMEMVTLVSCFESEEELKEVINNRLEELLKLYIKYDPIINMMDTVDIKDIKEQLSIMGRVRLVSIKEVFKEDNKEINIYPTNLKDLNKLIAGVILIAEKYIETGYSSIVEGTINLIQEYFSILTSYKEVLGV